jgi:hypothetical protein
MVDQNQKFESLPEETKNPGDADMGDQDTEEKASSLAAQVSGYLTSIDGRIADLPLTEAAWLPRGVLPGELIDQTNELDQNADRAKGAVERTETNPDGSVVHYNAEGKPVKIDYKNGDNCSISYGTDGLPAKLDFWRGDENSGWHEIYEKTSGKENDPLNGTWIKRLTDLKGQQIAAPIDLGQSAVLVDKSKHGEVDLYEKRPGTNTWRHEKFKTDGQKERTEDVASPGDKSKQAIESPGHAEKTDARVETNPDGSVVHFDDKGRVTEIDYAKTTNSMFSKTKFEYGDDGQLKRIERTCCDGGCSKVFERVSGDQWHEYWMDDKDKIPYNDIYSNYKFSIKPNGQVYERWGDNLEWCQMWCTNGEWD